MIIIYDSFAYLLRQNQTIDLHLAPSANTLTMETTLSMELS